MWFSVVGLLLDLFGILFLGFDLLRVQTRMRASALGDHKLFLRFLEDYRRVETVAENLSALCAYVERDGRTDAASDEEIAFNVRNLAFRVPELARNVSDLGEHSRALSAYLIARNRAVRDTALGTQRLTVVGLTLITVGFLLQIVGALANTPSP